MCLRDQHWGFRRFCELIYENSVLYDWILLDFGHNMSHKLVCSVSKSNVKGEFGPTHPMRYEFGFSTLIWEFGFGFLFLKGWSVFGLYYLFKTDCKLELDKPKLVQFKQAIRNCYCFELFMGMYCFCYKVQTNNNFQVCYF